nr:uncharacterized protein LOC112003540 [Quercus suber]
MATSLWDQHFMLKYWSWQSLKSVNLTACMGSSCQTRVHFKNLNHDMLTANGISFGCLVGQVAEFDLVISSHSLSLILLFLFLCYNPCFIRTVSACFNSFKYWCSVCLS